MFQIDRFDILHNAQGDQTGISIKFTSGQIIEVDFDDIPASEETADEKAAWLKDQLNGLLTVGTHPITGQPIAHYKANVVALEADPLKVAVSIEAL